MKTSTLLASACAIGLLALGRAVQAASAADYQPVPDVWPEPGEGTRPWSALPEFIKGVMDRQLKEESYVPGAVVVVVRDGEVIFIDGYGLADRDSGIPIDPEKTLFRLGSISKLLTWTAVMQLSEQGVLDLSGDVNAYLAESPVPRTFEPPVTLEHLMTHTAGFEANSFGYAATRGCSARRSIAETVSSHMPARVWPPSASFRGGEAILYNNFGPTLAGHIVSRQSREPFERYIERRLFEPLEMTRSTFREPVPPELAGAVAQSYQIWLTDEGKPAYQAVPFEYYHPIGPAGSASATARDVGHFMIAHLQKGRYKDRRILSESTADQMHGRRLSPHPQVNGAAYGFMERYVNGRRLLWHDGKMLGFYAELYLLPAENVGLFVAYTSEPPGDLYGDLMRRLMDEYFPPAHLPPLQPAEDAATRAARYAGSFAPIAHSYSTWEKRLTAGSRFVVEATAGGIHIENYPQFGIATDWIEVPGKEGVFRRSHSGDSLAFSRGADGRLYLLGEYAFAPLVRLQFHETPEFDEALLGLCRLVFAAAVLGTLGIALWRHGTPGLGAARWLAALVGTVDLATLWALDRALGWDFYDLMVALPWPVTTMMWLAFASAIVTPLLVAAVVMGWLREDGSRAGRIACSVVAVAGLVFLGWLDFWNLLGFRVA